MQLFNWSELGAAARAEVLSRPAVNEDSIVREQAAAIVAEVMSGGDAALLRLTERLDSVALDKLIVEDEELEEAQGLMSDGQLAAIRAAVDNVRRFHQPQLPRPITIETAPGVWCERISHPLDSVGLYVPAGTAPLPSAAIMLSVPALIAGCEQIIMCTPPRPDGKADPAVLVAARLAGVDRVFKAGGAQAIAAMAYGTETVPRVVKIFGPGNAWVTAAKIIVSTDPMGAAIDMPAGPSEVLVIADATANEEFVAADLLSQAEHGADSQVILVCTDTATAAAVRTAVARRVEDLGRRDIAINALEHGRIIVCDELADAVTISNEYAPEHLIVQTAAPRELTKHIKNAGSVFLGPWSPESAGDYCSGTNHVLPTYGAAKSYSGLGVDQFMRHMTVQELPREGLEGLAGTIVELAGMEGLDAHAAAVTCRLDGASK